MSAVGSMAAAKRVELSPIVEQMAAAPILAVLGTTRSNGSLQLNPVWFELRDGYFWLNSNTRRAWPSNVQRNGHIAMLLMDPHEQYRYAQIYGRLVEVIPDPKHELIDRLALRYTGKPFRELEPGEERITLKIEPVGVSGDLI